MRQKLLKTSLIPVIVLLFIFTSAGCKKDQLTVNQDKEYVEVKIAQLKPDNSSWQLTLKPDGTAEVLPTGDIRYRGTYRINGSKIKVKTEQNSSTYTFVIISENEIQETNSGVTLILK